MSVFLALFTALKFSKVLLTGGTMLLSLVLYAGLFGWPYAAGFVGLLFVHEMGHYLAAKQRGMDVSAPMFVPFLGALITIRQPPRDAETEAYMAYGGPFVGTLGAFAVYFWARDAGSMTGLAIAYAGFFLNLFNLLPVSPLDGGRICAVLGPSVWLLGAPLLLALLIWRPSPVLLIVLIMAFPQLRAAWNYDKDAPASRAYYEVGTQARIEYTVMYLGLVAVLAMVTYSLHNELQAFHRTGWE
jgi:Zn-dependent protease